MSIGTYSFKNVNAIFGVHEIEGFADDDAVITIEPAADAFTATVGAKGDMARSATNDDSVAITVKLLQTSKSVAVLQNLHLLDKETGAGVLPMIITNKVTGEAFTIPFAFISKQPTIARGKNQNNYEVSFIGNKFIPVMLEG